MAQMATVGKIKTHQAVVGPHERLVNLEVGRAAAEALDVDTPLLGVEVEGRESTSLASRLNGVNVLIATVVTSSRVALGVLVGHGRAKSIENRTGGDVLRGNQDNGFPLALDLFFLELGQCGKSRGAMASYHDLGDLRVGLGQRLLELL